MMWRIFEAAQFLFDGINYKTNFRKEPWSAIAGLWLREEPYCGHRVLVL